MMEYIKKKITSDKHFTVIVLLVAIFVFIAGSIYYWVSRNTERSVREQILHREQIISRSGATSISVFFEVAGRSLVDLTQNTDLRYGLGSSLSLRSFLDSWEDTPVVEIVVTDANGNLAGYANKVSETENKIDTQARAPVFNEEYFEKHNAQENTVVVGELLVPKTGTYARQSIIPISLPLYSNGRFRGAVTAGILVSELAREYLRPLNLSESTEVYILEGDGHIVYSPYPELAGVDVYEYLSRNPFVGRDKLLSFIDEGLPKSPEGKLELVWPGYYGKDIRTMLVAYTHLDFSKEVFANPEKWYIIISTPEEDALIYWRNVNSYLGIALLGALLIIITLSAVALYSIRASYRNGYTEGYLSGKRRDE